MIIRVSILISLFSSLFLAHQIEDSPKWKKYYRGTFIGEGNEYGYGGYLRFKRTTRYTFKDLRVFMHFIGSDSFKKIRYKDSSKFRNFNRFYNYGTVSVDQNSKVGVKIRYHGNQGLGMFVKDSENGHINAEIGMAYDISDYLNDSRKTSYLKTGLYWDQDFKDFEIKLEIEHYNQISDVIENSDLSRFEMLVELYWPIYKNWRVILGYETEQFDYSDNSTNSSKYFSIGYSDSFNFKSLKNKLF